MFTVPLCLKKDPGETDKGGFKKENGFTMEDNELYSSWKTGNVCQPEQSTKDQRRYSIMEFHPEWFSSGFMGGLQAFFHHFSRINVLF